MLEMEITENTKRRIMEYMKKGKRFDNRDLMEYRDIDIEVGVSGKAEGSTRVKMGKTEVVVGVKMGIAEPYTDSPDAGTMMVTAELLPLSSPKYEPGPPSVKSVELARIVDRGIRESGFIDFKKLCIKEGKEVWTIFIDIYPLNDDGNLIDAAAMAALASLLTAVFPKTEDGDKTRVLYGEFTNKKLPLSEKMPLTITFNKIGSSLFVDPVTEEEESSEARLTLEVSSEKKSEYINALQKGGEVTFTVEELNEILDNLPKVYKKLNESFMEKLKKAERLKK